ncbi:MAG: sorbosone dehydrogenase family protein [Cyclobacteriaceae bacterium]|nr:sorbosone dehydrogenase family protein [Cyclobacteriaceae bacterium]MCB0500488.1 sorbosone dehydrogenase family protein [Cyclobacteriaceae bacterium]MCB9238489.1 sorbosone dehydrogenase family protein [Flammeovirgaceae bacterium]MCO5271436.1 sorbosone dehydrogenase family protein [Cyclobacteriaceae bacterium]MCW5903615.1 sorbosone dehydrogenase family protein [Cyclobacteriaceae bacterium]
MKQIFCILSILASVTGCTSSSKESAAGTGEGDGSSPALTEASANLPLNTIKLPPGFTISVYAEVDNARSMALSPSGTLYVGNRNGDKVYAVRDTDGDHKADKRWVIASGLNMPNGVAFKNGDLYVAEVSRILKFKDIEGHLSNPGAPEVVYDQYPIETHHGWKYISFGPDGKLYVPVGAPCNICEPKKPIYATITRMDPDGSNMEIYASGIRNTVGFTWHPQTKELWFTDNGRDMMGDDVPPCELNSAPKAGMNFGYPYCHGGNIKDPEFGDKRPCSDFTPPVQNLNAHVAPLGLKFYTGDMFPEAYRNQIFIAEHGSWNRTLKSGHLVSLVKIENGKSVGYETFAEGWLDHDTQEAWGRPVDIFVMPDGSMLVSDDKGGMVYRIAYKG